MQYFCCFEFFQHDLPIDPSSMTHLRKRVEPDALEEVLKATVMVDTTVQPKAIVHPTDSRLYLEALLTLAGQAKKALPAPLKRLRFEVSLFSNRGDRR